MSEVQEVLAQEVKAERTRGPSGVVGVATPALTVRQMWHAAFFERIAGHGGVRRWQPKLGANVPSLKQFARGLAKSNEVASNWFANKKGALNQARSDANIKIAKEAAFSTHTEKRKKAANNAAKKK